MVPPSPVIVSPRDYLAALPNIPAVFLLWPKQGQPYLARTNVLRRRLVRLVARWQLDQVGERI